MKTSERSKSILVALLLMLPFVLLHGQNYPNYQIYKPNQSVYRINCNFPYNIEGQVSKPLLIAIPDGKTPIVKTIGVSIGDSYVTSRFVGNGFISNQKFISVRGQQILSMELSPTILLSSKKKIHIDELVLEIHLIDTEETQLLTQRLSAEWAVLIRNFVINPEDVNIDKISYPLSRDDGAEYLIIAPDVYLPALEELKIFRVQQGISTILTGTSETGNTVNEIKAYIEQAYNVWTIPPVAVLLVGDYEQLPAPVWQSFCVSDNMYADVNMDDLPDIFISRIPVSTISDLEIVVQKVMSYEINPPQNQNYYESPLACTDYSNHFSNSWMVSEIVNGWYANELGKTPVRQYVGSSPGPTEWPDTNLLQAFGPQGLGYIPETPGYICTYTGGNATGINNALNSGAFTFFSFDHGNVSGWSSPSYSIPDLLGLSGDPAYLFSINDLNGQFNYGGGDCMAEGFLKHIHGGLGVIAPSEITYSFITGWYAIGLMDGLWDDFYPGMSGREHNGFVRPCMANAYSKYFINNLAFPFNPNTKKTLYHEFHYFGEPWSVIHDEIPQELSVTHENVVVPGQTVFEVTANEGATVALVLNHQICSVAISEGVPMDLGLNTPIIGDTLHITVTMQGYKRYQANIFCVSGVGFETTQGADIQTIFPNPAKNQIYIDAGDALVSEIFISDLSGHILCRMSREENNYPESHIPISLSQFENGVYLVRIMTNNGMIQSKLIILN